MLAGVLAGVSGLWRACTYEVDEDHEHAQRQEQHQRGHDQRGPDHVAPHGRQLGGPRRVPQLGREMEGPERDGKEKDA